MTRLYKTIFCLLFITSFGLQAQGGEPAQRPVSVMSGKVIHLGKTEPLRNLAPRRNTTPDKKASVKKNRPPRNFVGRGAPYAISPTAQPQLQGFDPVLQAANPASLKTDGDITFLTNIEGLSSNSSPHDPSGDVGLNYYIQAVNATRFRVFNKDGSPASDPIAANTLWQQVGRSSAGDPIILYDQQAQRWVITEFPPGNELLMAVSETSDPFGSWDAYVFGTPSFPDYPKWSIWPNAYVITTNETGPGEQTVYVLDRNEILAGAPSADLQRIGVEGVGNGPGFFVATPVDWSGTTPPPASAKPMVMRLNDDAWGNVPKDEIDVIEFDVDFTNAGNTTYTVKSLGTAPYDSNPCSEDGPGFGCIPQLDENPIDGLPFTIMNQVHYRNFGTHESIVLNFITDGTAGDKIAGVRWMELRRNPAATDTIGWEIYQEGTFAPQDGLNRFMGAIAQDGQGNIALAYTTSSADEYPSLRVTGRFATDPPGEMTQAETTIIEGTGSIRFGNRYGDYAQMSVDPFNDRTFWFTSEYGDETRVTTRIAGFELEKDTNDLAARILINPEPITADNPEATPVTVRIKNVGIDAQTGFKAGYSMGDGPVVVEDIPGVTLAPDSTYEHTFTTPVDISQRGTYSFKAWSDLETDEFRGNDTIRPTVRVLAKDDIAVTGVDAPASACSSNAGIITTIFNPSGRPLTEAVLTVSLNGEVSKVQNWTGSLAPGEDTDVLVVLSGLTDGDFNVDVTATLPNGVPDELPGDNTGSAQMRVLTNGDRFVFALQLDDYPEETSWEIVGDDGVTYYSGGNYNQLFALIEVNLCLDPSICYSVNVFDSFSDGIFGDGGFTVTNNEGEVLVDENGSFGSLQTGEFCASGVCLLEVSTSVADASGPETADGTVMVNLDNTNGGDFTVSFDGGPASAETLFTGLLPGTYTIVASNGEGCEVTREVTVGACSLMATATAVDSSIVVVVDAGVEPFEYSLNGVNFQPSNEFLDLINGSYNVVVRDGQGCSVVLGVEVDDPNDVYTATAGQRIVVSPNPTEGVFKVELQGMPNRGTLLPIEIYDASGRVIQYGNIVRYDAAYFGHFSLVNYPVGTYYLRIVDADLNQLLQIVKQ